MTRAEREELKKLRSRIRPELMELLTTYTRHSNTAYWQDDQGYDKMKIKRAHDNADDAELALLKYLYPLHGYIV